MNESAFDFNAALKDLEHQALLEKRRGVPDQEIAEQFGEVPTPGAMETRTFPRANSAEFICDCTVKVSSIDPQTAESATPYVPSEQRPYRENLMTDEEKQIARRRLPEIRAILDKDK